MVLFVRNFVHPGGNKDNSVHHIDFAEISKLTLTKIFKFQWIDIHADSDPKGVSLTIFDNFNRLV